jgi:hypothetical protein
MVSSLRHRRTRGRFLCALLGLFVLVSAAAAANPDSKVPSQPQAGQALAGKPLAGQPLAGEDEWELAVAADSFGHVYVLYPEYGPVSGPVSGPGCDGCLLPALTLVISNDNGSTWQSPLVLTPPASGQFNPQIVVDPVDHRTVYAAWLQNDRRDTLLAKSSDFGQSWSMVVADHGSLDRNSADHGSAEVSKPVLAVRGQNVYVASGRGGKMWMASSHDGGITFTSSVVNENLELMESLAGGATVDPEGNVYLAWAGYVPRNTTRGRVNLYVSKSSTGGRSWVSNLMDVSNAPHDCSAYHCQWGYSGAQITIASDSAGVLYALWSASPSAGANSTNHPERIFFASSTTSGATWSPKADMSTAAKGVKHVLPTIVAGAVGNVRIAWVDSRNSPDWDAYVRNSTNGGATWSAESRISSAPQGYATLLARISGLPSGDSYRVEAQGPIQIASDSGL